MKKIVTTIIGMILLVSLVSAQSITLNGNNYEITNYTFDEIDEIYCLEFDRDNSKMPCSNFITESKGTLIFNETAMIDLNYIVYCWSHDCSPEDNPFYEENNVINNSGSVVIADDFVVESRLYKGDAYSEVSEIKTTPSVNNFFEPIDYTGTNLKGNLGIGWLLKLVIQIVDKINTQEDRINTLESELCKKDNSYSFCEGGIIK